MEGYEERGALDRITRVQVVLFGSLAKTGVGHGTDRALMLGLSGEDPVTVEIERVPEIIGQIRASGVLNLLGKREIPFDLDEDIIYRRNETRPYHSNAMDIRVQTSDGRWREETYYSVGGGFVVKEGEEPSGDGVTVPYPVESGAELRTHCEKTGLWISELVRRNERVHRSDGEIDARLHRIWETMKSTAYRGCRTTGKLPGGLDVERRAPRLNRKLTGRDGAEASRPYEDLDEWVEFIRSRGREFHDVNKWVTCFALATNEENAAFGRIVTAPTNGAAGVIPAVLLYYICFDDGTDEDVRRFLLTAGQIGILFKQHATLSAAMGGCQAEIGVSSAMASAALTECKCGTVEQAMMAAEIAMEHHLGMTCDPVGGLVQIPCIERNSMGAMKAITASNIALESDPAQAKVSLDTVIKTMWQTAQDMNEKYKETSEGGLAANIPVSVTEC
jgi:L-serine dehydratase